jgi:hypothetical protein
MPRLYEDKLYMFLAKKPLTKARRKNVTLELHQMTK